MLGLISADRAALCAIARACVVALLPALAMSKVQVGSGMRNLFNWMTERLDFNAAKDRRRISSIESFPFDAHVESRLAARPVIGPAGDIDFLVRYRPIIIEVWRRSFGFR